MGVTQGQLWCKTRISYGFRIWSWFGQIRSFWPLKSRHGGRGRPKTWFFLFWKIYACYACHSIENLILYRLLYDSWLQQGHLRSNMTAKGQNMTTKWFFLKEQSNVHILYSILFQIHRWIQWCHWNFQKWPFWPVLTTPDGQKWPKSPFLREAIECGHSI